MARLLAGANRPSPLSREAEFERIWARARPARRRLRWAGLLGLAASTALALLVVRGRNDEFVARGGPSLQTVRVFCDGDCRAGGKLYFEALGLRRSAYLAAYAHRADGTLIWYFPAAGADGPLVERDGILADAVLLGAEHSPGRYEVTMVLSEGPLGGEQAKAAVAGRTGVRAVMRGSFDVR